MKHRFHRTKPRRPSGVDDETRAEKRPADVARDVSRGRKARMAVDLRPLADHGHDEGNERRMRQGGARRANAARREYAKGEEEQEVQRDVTRADRGGHKRDPADVVPVRVTLKVPPRKVGGKRDSD